jgi:hypothetical protein
VYAAGYNIGEGVQELFAPRAAALETVLADLEDPGAWLFSGDGVGVGEEAIRSTGGRIAEPDAWVPRASSLLWLAAVAPGVGRVADSALWEPGYVRLPAAQRAAGR